MSAAVQHKNQTRNNQVFQLVTISTQQRLRLTVSGAITPVRSDLRGPHRPFTRFRKREDVLYKTALTASTTPVTPTVEVAVSARPTGMFDDHPLPTQLLPIQLVHGVVSVTVVLELNEPISETEAMLFKWIE